MARRSTGFSGAARALSRFGTPANALVFSNLLASILVALNFAHGLVGAFNAIILLAVMSSLLPYALCALAELMILPDRAQRAGPEIGQGRDPRSARLSLRLGDLRRRGGTVFLGLCSSSPAFPST